MGNSRNKILVFAQSAIEGQNIQSQSEYEGSSEREDGVKTGIANGDNFNKLAKQVSTISSSIAEFIVNNTEGVVVGDTSSVEQISGYISQAVIKLITENLPPKEPGINVIDSSSEIVDFNQLTETGIYYIYKDLLNKPYSSKTNYVLTVLNFTKESGITCIQLASSYVESNSSDIPAIVNDGYIARYKQTDSFSSWDKVVALDLSTNKAVSVSKEASADKDVSKYMVISTDEDGNNVFKTASREVMRSALGINALGDKVNLQTDVEGILDIKNGGTGTDNGFNFKNFIVFDTIANKIGFEIGGTLEDFCLKLPNRCAFVTLIQGAYFSDIHTFGGILRVSKYDNNSTWLYLDRFSLIGNEWQQAIGTVQNNVFSGWKIIRNNNGSIPAELIPPTVLTYTNNQGTWTETKLSDGKILLEGWGLGFDETSEYLSIKLPKICVSIGNINPSIIIYGVVSGSCGHAVLGLLPEAFKGFCGESNSFIISAGKDRKLLGYTWQFKGILA